MPRIVRVLNLIGQFISCGSARLEAHNIGKKMRFRNPNSVKELLLQLSLKDISGKNNVDRPILKETTLCAGKYSKVTVDGQNSSAFKRFMLGMEKNVENYHFIINYF